MDTKRGTIKPPEWLMERIKRAAKKSGRTIIGELVNRFK